MRNKLRSSNGANSEGNILPTKKIIPKQKADTKEVAELKIKIEEVPNEDILIYHISDILKYKKRAIKGSELHRITTLVPDAEYFIGILVNRGENTAGIIASLTKILNIYGKELLTEAIQEVIVHECPRLKNLYFSLKRLEAQSSQKNIPCAEIDSGKYSNLVVNHHEPSHYDKIAGIKKC